MFIPFLTDNKSLRPLTRFAGMTFTDRMFRDVCTFFRRITQREFYQTFTIQKPINPFDFQLYHFRFIRVILFAVLFKTRTLSGDNKK